MNLYIKETWEFGSKGFEIKKQSYFIAEGNKEALDYLLEEGNSDFNTSLGMYDDLYNVNDIETAKREILHNQGSNPEEEEDYLYHGECRYYWSVKYTYLTEEQIKVLKEVGII